jgi:V/A-type H+-transporting ATPase subunit K
VVGIFAGLAMGASAVYQGKAAAYAADAFAETGQGFGNYILVVGLIETVALFVMVFFMGVAG